MARRAPREGGMEERTWSAEREMAASAELHKMSNWGRWGAADERGAANLADAEAVARGISAVRRGRVYGLAQTLGDEASPRLLLTPAARHFMMGGDESNDGDHYVAFPGHQSAVDGLEFSIH